MSSKVSLGLAAAILLAAGSAQAATVSTTFNNKITIAAECIVGAVSDIDFGTHGILATNIDGSTDINVTCTNSTAFSVALDKGLTGANTSARVMTGPGAPVSYSLYSDAARSSNWGNVYPNDTVQGTGTGSAQTLTVFGRVPPQAAPTPGAYSDTVRVTVSY